MNNEDERQPSGQLVADDVSQNALSTFIGVAQASGLTDERGQPRNLRQGLIVDAWATLTAGLFGSSSGTAYVESIAGIRMGGRTGTTGGRKSRPRASILTMFAPSDARSSARVRPSHCPQSVSTSADSITASP